MKRQLFIALCFFLPMPAMASESPAQLPAKVREFLAEKYLGGMDPSDPRLLEAVEVIPPPQAALIEAGRIPWEDGQLKRFARDKLFLFLTCADGKRRALMFRKGKKRMDKPLEPGVERVLRRLYASDSLAAAADPKLLAWQARKDINPASTLDRVLSRLTRQGRGHDEETCKRARSNLAASRGGGRSLAAALGALGESHNALENLWAGTWLLSRMDRMAFHRKNRTGSIKDLDAMDGRTFFENVAYAVKARKTFPWGQGVSDHHFLQHVLSPRGTGEPLQRWRRHFYEALAPEMAGMTAEDSTKAVKFATTCCYTFFRYEGATTWEDFGMLTALAVHEGRCEDCSNVENAMIRAIGLPACQAFTPYWAHADGNHAWTVVPSLPKGRRDGKKGAKIYIKTWDGLEDVTDLNTKVTTLTLPTKATPGVRAALTVWNMDKWRVVARSTVGKGTVEFQKVGCGRNFVFAVQVKGEEDRLVRVLTDGTFTLLDNRESLTPEAGTLHLEFDKSGKLGEFRPDEEYRVMVHTVKGWKDIPSERLSTGAVGFGAETDRLYRVWGKGLRDRPFTVTKDETTGLPVILKH
jgi:hypothetical protein